MQQDEAHEDEVRRVTFTPEVEEIVATVVSKREGRRGARVVGDVLKMNDSQHTHAPPVLIFNLDTRTKMRRERERERRRRRRRNHFIINV